MITRFMRRLRGAFGPKPWPVQDGMTEHAVLALLGEPHGVTAACEEDRLDETWHYDIEGTETWHEVGLRDGHVVYSATVHVPDPTTRAYLRGLWQPRSKP